MSLINQKIITFFTCNGNAEDMMNFYAENIPDMQIEEIVYFNKGDLHGDEGKVFKGIMSYAGLKLSFLDIQSSHPAPAFNWSISLLINCLDEVEFDMIFENLTSEGNVIMGPEAIQEMRKCAWLCDKFGMTWQLVWA